MGNKHRLDRIEARLGGVAVPTTPSPETVALLDRAARIKSEGGSLEDVSELRKALRVIREEVVRGWR